ncbi:MAG: TetR/AcrR family transcriptional regulator [Marmoricola sp.]
MNTTRTYDNSSRAAASAATRTRMLDAALELGRIHRLADIPLERIATEAGVTVKTLLRHFGSRAELFEAASREARARIGQQRSLSDGSVEEAMRVLLDHYEEDGDVALLFLSQERDDPIAAEITSKGRKLHRAWVSDAFADHLHSRPTSESREAVLDLLVVATDVYTWKLLRRDRRLSRARTEERMTTLVRAVLDNPREKKP